MKTEVVVVTGAGGIGQRLRAANQWLACQIRQSETYLQGCRPEGRLLTLRKC